ncbi:MAG: bifunctional homocysteine S-methyltransferase/methylenetetrahydrofolate reductase [Calditrichaeota bacterium]|nr:bifunctional homocysteine S-methyltransferase/methylenetetrahydrofolate reductase [Calditrichota bacterium]
MVVGRGLLIHEESLNRTPFLKKLQDSIVVCDGAMGTMLYAHGVFINRCFDELNISSPETVMDVHREYAAAGAEILETNTFGANYYKLKPHGLEDKVHLINKQGAENARKAGGDDIYIAGSIGPLGVQLAPLGKVTREDAKQAFRDQAEGLIDGGVDLFILETFMDVNQTLAAIEAIKELCDMPIVSQITFDKDGTTPFGLSVETVVQKLIDIRADIIGTNCSVGPQPMLDVIERISKAGAKFISAQPNAGNPRVVEGRYLYMSTPEYHAEFARRFITAGANIVGGCCGTTPAHIKAIVNAVRAMQPHKTAVSISLKPKKEVQVDVIPLEEKSALAARMQRKFVTSVEVVSPRGINPQAVLSGVRKLVGFGVDAINIPDGPRASARMSPMALAQLIERSIPVETILHYCCRDRNILGMQSDLLGAYTLGLRNILAITGDPPKLGDYPDATAVFDVDAIGLTRIIRSLNHGYDVAGNPIGSPTGWHIGVGANPGAVDIGLEIDRLYQKVEAGAEYILTQPIFDIDQLQHFFQKIESIKIPIMAGIMPLMSFRTIEFLNNEVPGVTVPQSIAMQMQKAKDKEDAKKLGIQIAQEAILKVKSMEKVRGVYLMPPFNKDKYEIAIQVLEVLH